MLHLLAGDLARLDHLGHLLDRGFVVGSCDLLPLDLLLFGGAVSHPHASFAFFETVFGVRFADLTRRDLSPKIFPHGANTLLDPGLELIEVELFGIDHAAILRDGGRFDGGGRESKTSSSEHGAGGERTPSDVQWLGLV